MYSGSSDGEGHDGSSVASRKIPPTSSMLWVRNLRRYIGSGAGLGSESLMELETKRILLDIFKEKQQKSAEAVTIPSFYKKKPEEGSISQRVQRLAKYRFLKARIDMSELDEDSDGFLQPHEMEAYIRGLIPNLAQLREMLQNFVIMYCCIAASKFFFFCDPIRRGKACIKKVMLSNCLQELMELHQESEEVTDTEQKTGFP